MFADKNGWNYSQTSGVNPTITVSACTLVNFTIVNEDNLTHTLVINSGNNENSTDYMVIASVNATSNMSQGYYFFISPGNYTYWDLYHPGTSVGTINVTNASSTTSAIYSPATYSYNNKPHNLTIAPGSSESSYQDTLLTTSQITTIPGTVSHVMHP